MEQEASTTATNAPGNDFSDVDIDDFLPADEDEVAESSLPQGDVAAKEEGEETAPDVEVKNDITPGVTETQPEETKRESEEDVNGKEDVDVDAADQIPEESTPAASACQVEREAPPVADTHDAVSQHEDIQEGQSEREAARLEESRLVGGEVIFDGLPPVYNGWDSLRWMSYSGARQLKLFQHVFRYQERTQKALFWTKVDKEYAPRALAVYQEPNIIMVLRRPVDEEELLRLVGSTEPGDTWVVESVVDPTTCKLQLSNLTHPTSTVDIEHHDERSRSLFEIISPAEKIRLSVVRIRDEAKREERSFTDSGAFFETNNVEKILIEVICDAHKGDEDVHDENLLRHQGKKDA